AVECLGRVARPDSLPPLFKALNDDTAMVRQSAAKAIREIATRRDGAGEAMLARVLEASGPNRAPRSTDSAPRSNVRVRRAAIRVFGQHFRWLTNNNRLLDQVLACSVARDEDPVVRTLATQALPAWWYWNNQMPERRNLLHTALLTVQDETANPLVHKVAKQALYNLLDEDIQYIYNFYVTLL